MDKESQVFRALADQNRRVLLDLLLESDRSVGEMSDKLTISQPAVSQGNTKRRSPQRTLGAYAVCEIMLHRPLVV